MLDQALSFADDWTLVEDQLHPRNRSTGALFTTSNGYLGVRGRRREPVGTEDGAAFLGGCHETRPYAHPERSFGLPVHYQTLVAVTDPLQVRITIDGTALTVETGTWLEHRRWLDLRSGCVLTSGTWRSPAGIDLAISSRRMASFEEPGLLWSWVQVEPLEGAASVALDHSLQANTGHQTFPDEPEALARAWGRIFRPVRTLARDRCVGLAHITSLSRRVVACAAAAAAESTTAPSSDVEHDRATLRYEAHTRAGQPLTVGHRIALVDDASSTDGELLASAAASAERAAGTSFDGALDRQRAVLDGFWRVADVELDGAEDVARAVRFCAFGLFQATVRKPERASPAKGLTGHGYQGHQLWDQEVYVGHALSLLAPEAARSALLFRCRTLPDARARAAQLSHRGAQFPWRTIDGTEASPYLPAGAAQLHISADIAWAVSHHVRCSGDDAFLVDHALALLVETARLWMSVGHYGDDGRFRIHGVTGPDEYTALVDDNLFTNVMALDNLEQAATRLARLAERDPGTHRALCTELCLDPSEPEAWRRAAAAMVLPYDEVRGVHAQDATFLDKPRWDLDATPEDRRPLQDHHDLLTLYRHQVLKQADVVLAHFLQGHRFPADQRRRDYDYYAPLTTHDSSLSAPVHAIVAADVGHLEEAWRFLQDAALADLDDRFGSLEDGLHLAAAGGAWLAVACGFGGLRVDDDRPAFRPQLPPALRRLRFRIAFRGSLLEVDTDEAGTTYRVLDGGPVDLLHEGEKVRVEPDEEGQSPSSR